MVTSLQNQIIILGAPISISTVTPARALSSHTQLTTIMGYIHKKRISGSWSGTVNNNRATGTWSVNKTN